MARVEDLIANIADPILRQQIAAEVMRLKLRKKFGLVFEEHLPEIVELPGLLIKEGGRVAKRRAKDHSTYLVTRSVNGKRVVIVPEAGGPEEEAVRDDLVVVKRFGEPMFPALAAVDQVWRSSSKPAHVVINSDNYHALQLLLYGYERRVDVIYIDPPYNSGARDWKYNNDYVDRVDLYRHSKWLSMIKKRLLLARRLLKPDGVLIVTIDENEVHHLGTMLEDVFPEYLRHTVTIVINPKGTGKLNFARVDEYAIFCVPNTGNSVIKGIPTALANAANPGEGALFTSVSNPIFRDESDSQDDDEDDNGEGEEGGDDDDDTASEEFPFPAEELGEWELRHARRRGSESSYRAQRKNQFYPIYVDAKEGRVIRAGESLLPVEKKPSHSKVGGLTPVWPIDKEGNERCWRLIPSKMQELIDARRVILGRYDEQRNTWTLNLWYKKSESKKLKTVWWKKAHDAGTHGTTLLHNILGRRAAFPFPKSLYAVGDALAAVVRSRPEAIILDFFAGSGTTLHATALLNSQDGGRRRCIMVTNNEVAEKTAKKLASQGLEPGAAGFERYGICEAVTWPRCKAVLTGRRDSKTPLAGTYLDGRPMSAGFEENAVYYKLDFLDPAEVNRGERFEAILPILWLFAGAQGELEPSKGSGKWLMPKGNPFAVLLREASFGEFLAKLAERPDINYAFLVTDSVEAFHEMSGELKGRRCIQLYKSYLDTFKINLETSRAL